MCLIAILFRVTEAPVIVGANREEAYARGGDPPELWHGPVAFVAGRDPLAGGTWLGVNAFGLVVAVTNRDRGSAPPQPRSRGLLVADLLACSSAAEAQRWAQSELSPRRYAPCNLLVMDAERAAVFHCADWLRVLMLPPGVHVLATGDLNDRGDPRADLALQRLQRRCFVNPSDAVSELVRLCSLNQPPAPICVHGSERGTVSSTILALRPALGDGTLLHAQGSPDRKGYQDRSVLLAELAGWRGRRGGEV